MLGGILNSEERFEFDGGTAATGREVSFVVNLDFQVVEDKPPATPNNARDVFGQIQSAIAPDRRAVFVLAADLRQFSCFNYPADDALLFEDWPEHSEGVLDAPVPAIELSSIHRFVSGCSGLATFDLWPARKPLLVLRLLDRWC